MGLRHGTRTGTAKWKSQKSRLILEFPFFENSKIIGLFRCHWGGPKKVDHKSIHYVFVQTKDVFGQKSKFYFFLIFGPADLRARGATLTVILVVIIIIILIVRIIILVVIYISNIFQKAQIIINIFIKLVQGKGTNIYF
jgi:hypothetical protein